MRLTVSARVFPDGKLAGTVAADETSELPFEGWLEFLALLNSLLAPTESEPT